VTEISSSPTLRDQPNQYEELRWREETPTQSCTGLWSDPFFAGAICEMSIEVQVAAHGKVFAGAHFFRVKSGRAFSAPALYLVRYCVFGPGWPGGSFGLGGGSRSIRVAKLLPASVS
jgi:hypothetical protein